MARGSNLPETTEELRAAARKKAMVARQARAKFKDDIHAGKYTLEEAISVARADEILVRLHVEEFLRAFVGMGPKKTENAMQYAHISKTRRISGLSDAQAERLREWFSSRVRR